MNPFHCILAAMVAVELGSFANVCIYRWPRNGSIFKPSRSACPWCHHQITWYDNIPVVSFLILRGLCRFCRSRISWRYPTVEIGVALLILGNLKIAFISGQTHPAFLASIVVFSLFMVVTTAVDWEWKIIPNQASYSLMVTGFILAPWNPFFSADAVWQKLIQSGFGGLTGAALLILTAKVGKTFFRKEVMGGGDIKLLAAFGTFLGWKGAVTTLIFGSLSGSLVALVGILLHKIRRNQYIPFGPFLNLGAWCSYVLMLTKAAWIKSLLSI